MKWNHNTYKVIKSLRPIDLYEIMTRFNIHTMKTFVDWFLEITPEIERELKLEQLGI